MLRVLMKYDFKRLWKPALLTLITTLVASFGAVRLGLLLFFDDGVIELITVGTAGLLPIGLALAMIGLGFTAIAALIVLEILVVVTAYRHLMSDEGYLTFTLPTTPGKVLFSSYFVSLVWVVLASLAAIMGVALAILTTPELAKLILEDFAELWEAIKFTDVIFWLMMTIFAIPYGLMVIYFSFICGCSITGKYRILASIGIYYLISAVTSFFTQFSIFFISNDAMMTVGYPCVSSVCYIGMTLGLFFISRYLLQKRLNLQ